MLLCFCVSPPVDFDVSLECTKTLNCQSLMVLFYIIINMSDTTDSHVQHFCSHFYSVHTPHLIYH